MKPAPTERVVHTSILHWLRNVLPGSAFIAHTPMEGRRGWKSQRDLKALGAVAGMPDLGVIWDGCAYFLEVKRPAPSKTYPSKAQRACHAKLEAAGAKVAVVRSIEDARDALKAWKIPTKEFL